ncbi:MAG: hypothetical protein V1663_04895 [archaeon]
MNKKAQSAMEYLMTYGWAILVVLIALGALFYLGVFSPKTPNSCIGTAPVVCTDLKAVSSATAGSVILTLGISGGTANTLTGASITFNGAQPCNIITQSNGVISSTTPSSITFGNCGALNKDSKISGTLPVTYTPSVGGQPHTITVQFSGTVE